MAVLIGQAVGMLVTMALLAISGELRPGMEALAWSALASAVGALGLFVFYLALSRGQMGLVAPLTALIAASIPAAIGLARGDEAGVLVLVGMLSALAAVVLISMPERRLGVATASAPQGARARESLLIVIAGLAFAAFFLAIDASHEAGGALWWPLLGIKVAGTATALGALLAVLLLRRAPPTRVTRVALIVGMLAGLGDLGGNLFFVLATGIGELAVVVVLASL